MKKTLLALILSAAALSCSKDEVNNNNEPCTCTQTTYEIGTKTVYENGQVHLVTTWDVINIIDVVCQDETDGKEPIGNGLYIEITCE